MGLLADKQKGLIQDIELQPEFVLQPSFKKNGKTHRAITYTPDYKITYPDGSFIIVDVKGKRTEVFNIKHKLFERAYPELHLTIVDV